MGTNAWVRRIGGSASVTLVVDGEPIAARRGETVLTAILASRRFLRPFEFAAERRAGFCLIGACQDCWLRLADGTPIRGCTTRVTGAMDIVSDEHA